jgi:hypothetical protein
MICLLFCGMFLPIMETDKSSDKDGVIISPTIRYLRSGGSMKNGRNLRPKKSSKNNNNKNNGNKKASKKTAKTTSNYESNVDRPICGRPTPSDLGDLCPAGDEDCVVLFSEDYETPLYDFSDPSLSYDEEICTGPEGAGLFHMSKKRYLGTLNLAYGPDLYDELKLNDLGFPIVAVVYLDTWKDPVTGKQLTFSDGRGRKYAIRLMSPQFFPDLGPRLELNTQGRRFVNFGMDIAPFTADPCLEYSGVFPTRFVKLNVRAEGLDEVQIKSDTGQPDAFSVLWTRVCGSLDAALAVDGKITFGWGWDQNMNEADYALFDNVAIIASNDPNKLPAGC